MTDLFRHLEFDHASIGHKPGGPLSVDTSSYIGQHLIWYTKFDTPDTVYTQEGILHDQLNIVQYTDYNLRDVGKSLRAEWWGGNFFYNDTYVRPHLSDQMTYFADVYIDHSTGNNSFLFGNINTGTGYNWGFYRANTDIRAYVKNSSGTPANVTSFSRPDNNRYILVCTYDSSSIKFYINGELIGETSHSSGIDDTDLDLRFNYWNGASVTSTDYFSAGVLDVALPDSLALQLSLDPYMMLIPEI